MKIIVNNGSSSVLLYEKILKEAETEETRLFVTFLSLLAFGLGGPGPPRPPPGYAYDLKRCQSESKPRKS